MGKSGNKYLKLSESGVKSIYNKTVTYQKSKDPDVYFRAKSFSLKTFFSSQSNREIR